MYITISEQVREDRIRHKAQKYGYRLKKSRTQNIHADNLGGWQVIYEPFKCVVAGSRWELTLSEVEDFIFGEEAKQGIKFCG